tara:strand:- start:714 stop:1412 length:699 start_codon:yes stop_codon:yes gene_type:complete
MALKLLNPGLRPLGQFDLHDGVALLGGEYVELQTFDPEPAVGAGAGEGYAADVGAMLTANAQSIAFNTPAFRSNPTTARILGGLADEGTNEYGTLFGQIVGSTAGRGTVFLGAGAGGAAITAGPASHIASGKVTVFDKEGLYGISGPGGSAAQLTTDAPAPNATLFATTGGVLTDTDPLDGQGVDPVVNATGQVGIYVATVSDTSLVSTTARAVGDAAVLDHHAIYYAGNAA